MRIRRKLIGLLLLGILALIGLYGQVYAAESGEKVGFDELTGKTAGVMTGTPQDEIVRAKIKDVKLEYFNSFTDLYMALKGGKIDFCVNSTIAFRIMQEDYPEFGYINQGLKEFQIGAIFPKNDAGAALRDEFNDYVAKIRKDGTLDELQKYWLYPNDWKNVEIPEKGSKVIRMAASSAVKPFAFRLNGQFAGSDIAVIAGFCREKGYGLTIDDVDFAGVLSGIAAGKYDIAAGQISWTAEREKTVNFSDFYCVQTIVPIVRTADYPEGVLVSGAAATKVGAASNGKSGTDGTAGTAGDGSGDARDKSFISQIKQSFHRTVIEEGRWKLILSGLGITLVITIFGFLLANLIGALFCAMMMSRRRGLRRLADIYSRIMQGTPIVVILLILYYIVFGSVELSGVIVAIIGFGITSGAYLAQLFQGAIASVDGGQMEAALASGFTPREGFLYIVFPQALRNMLTGYFSQLISLMKGTAIVGYIAVADLTKTGDIIRGSTFEPFFPLLIVAVIYFLIACILLSVLKQIQKKLAPKRVGSSAGASGKRETRSAEPHGNSQGKEA